MKRLEGVTQTHPRHDTQKALARRSLAGLLRMVFSSIVKQDEITTDEHTWPIRAHSSGNKFSAPE